MRPRFERLLLIFSLALNTTLVSLAVVGAREAPSGNRNTEPPAGFSPRWHGQRAARLGRALRLDPSQRASMQNRLGIARPELQAARRQLARARSDFRDTLRQGDVATARAARAQVSRAQARLDSLSAEAMLAELAVLRPDQRERYVRWTFEQTRFRSREDRRPSDTE